MEIYNTRKRDKDIEVYFGWEINGCDEDLSESYSSRYFKYQSLKEINKFNGVGEYIALGLWAKKESDFTEPIRINKERLEERFSEIIFSEDVDIKTANFEILGWCIYQFTHIVYNILHRYAVADKEDWKHKVPLKQEVLDDIFSDNLNISERLQYWVNGYVNRINKIFNEVEYSENALYELYSAINDNISNSKLLPDYLKNGARCVAIYVTDYGKKIISFSGYVDCTDINIIQKFKFVENDSFINKIKNIATMLNAELATLVGNVAKFEIQYKTIIQKTLLENDTLQSVKDQDYSCCERKIFAHLYTGNDYIDNGVMYVKLRPCSKCILGIMYYNGSFINARTIEFRS